MKTNIQLLLLLATFALSISSCKTSSKLEVSNIRALRLNCDANQNLNYGVWFKGTLEAEMITGEVIDVTNHRKVDFSSDVIVKNKDQFVLQGRPSTFADEKIAYSILASDDDESFGSKDSLTLNYNGPSNLDFSGHDGANAKDQGSKSQRLVGRNGKDGDHGDNGENGGHSGSYIARIWKDSNVTMVYIQDLQNGLSYRYKSKTSNTVNIDLSGGKGGNGGNGGDGSDGKDGEITSSGSKLPGNGGNGGNGGSGGHGGTGGSITIYLHPNAGIQATDLHINNLGGLPGTFGEGGKAGNAGKAAAGQNNALNGTPGVRGINGLGGIAGTTPIILVEDFDPSLYK